MTFLGDVVLRNLRLRPDALAALRLPVSVAAGLCGTLTLRVPWSRLGREPVCLSLDRVYLLARPAPGEEAEMSDAARVRQTRPCPLLRLTWKLAR